MIITKNKFKSSVNIKLDLGNEWIAERYIPTPTHSESLTGLLEGFLDKGNKSHILIGSYGSGKSMVGTLIANVVSKNIEQDTFIELISKFDKVTIKEETVGLLLNQVRKLDKTYIPVVINGNQGNFREAIISSIHKSISKYGYDFSIPSYVDEIKNKILLWENQFHDTFVLFENYLNKNNWTIESFIQDINEYEAETIDWFKKIYPSLTAGAELSHSYNLDITEHLTNVLDELDKKNLGIYLVYDEFGRFLQSLDKYETVEAMQDIQEIAEVADHHRSANFHILLITHRNLNQYFLSYGEDLQNEFKRIQGRFKIYHTQSDPATFIRLASQVTSGYRNNLSQEYKFENEIIKYDLFPELNGREMKTIVVENSFPLHPVTLFTLPRLANAVAQNERTLFTFLESNEKGGLANYFHTEKTWYFVSSLFDYFEPAFQEFMSDSLIGKSYLKYLRVKKRVEDSASSHSELQILKLFTLWDIANIGSKRKLTKDFISFALNWKLIKVNEIIEILENKKLLRYRLFDDNWEVFEGSSIDLNVKIKDKNLLGINKLDSISIINKVLDTKYAYPKRYNDEKNMIRFAAIKPIFANDLSESELQHINKDSKSDFKILYVIPEKDADIEKIRSLIVKLSKGHSRIIYALPKKPFNNFKEEILELSSVEKLLEDKYLLNEDPIVEEELLKIRENKILKLRQHLAPILQYKGSFWIHEGTNISVKSKIALSEQLSLIASKYYGFTPIINNESFNRRNISKQQLNGAKEVIDAIISGESDYKFNGPAKLIYASIIKNNSINAQNESEEITLLRQKLMKEIKSESGNFLSLIKIFKGQDFGIREPIIPVLLTAILKNEWKYIMFYHKDGSFINDVNGDILYDRMLDKPENYTFSHQKLDNKYKSIIDVIDVCFESYRAELDSSYHPSVRLNRMLLRWLNSLPKIAQKTNKLSTKAVLFKKLITKGEFEPDTALKELLNLNLNVEMVNKIKQECEEYSQNHKKQIEKTVFELTNTNSFEELFDYILNQNELLKVDNKLFNLILSTDKNNWINKLSSELVGVSRDDWSDATSEVFFKTVKSLLEINIESLKDEYHEVKVNSKTLAIPKRELSPKGNIIYSNVKTDLELMARKLPKEEITALLYKLLVDYYEENK
ncbi:hypothetical protein M3204_15615 [Mesobacillus subterraneus]|uniref:hypothetical protein n=1 Tax=Mesobacillus subterraneus TaxID=285983 RepID=UPI0020423B80|nr:hypothetical protein [Mesobacillus subterraneus]MCM3665845.1 hypothetical protein [Mesobacillus subterraneus]MCM3684764.1 hypothetical protein [Mesobacillus subterraneus]